MPSVENKPYRFVPRLRRWRGTPSRTLRVKFSALWDICLFSWEWYFIVSIRKGNLGFFEYVSTGKVIKDNRCFHRIGKVLKENLGFLWIWFSRKTWVFLEKVDGKHHQYSNLLLLLDATMFTTIMLTMPSLLMGAQSRVIALGIFSTPVISSGTIFFSV